MPASTALPPARSMRMPASVTKLLPPPTISCVVRTAGNIVLIEGCGAPISSGKLRGAGFSDCATRGKARDSRAVTTRLLFMTLLRDDVLVTGVLSASLKYRPQFADILDALDGKDFLDESRTLLSADDRGDKVRRFCDDFLPGHRIFGSAANVAD